MAPSGEMMIEWVAKNARVVMRMFPRGTSAAVVKVVEEVVLGRGMF